MADDISGNDNGDEVLVLSTPASRVETVSFEDAMDETTEGLEQKQKILSKIICIPGEKTFVADIVKKMFKIIHEDIDNKATITAASGLTIDSVKDFPKGQKFSDAFKPEQSDDTKSVKMVFYLTTSNGISTLKRKTKLLDHLRSSNMYLDESHSGSDHEEMIGYFLGIQADKIHLTGFTEDIKEIFASMILQDGEEKMRVEARNNLTWNDQEAPPFFVRVRNITRKHQGAEYASKALAIMVAKEHASFYKAVLTRAFEDKLMTGLGRYYNLIDNDRMFYRAIKWHNDQIEKTGILPILGITRQAMSHPLKVKRPNEKESTVSTIRKEICNSGYFATIHSTKQTNEEGRWLLVVADKTKTKDATEFLSQMMNSIFNAKKCQIPQEAKFGDTVPEIEGREQTMARSTNPFSGQQGSAWGSVLSKDYSDTKGGSRMKNMPRRRNRKIVELSFDPESKEDFPDLSKKSKDKKQSGSKSIASKESKKSEASSESDVSAVTKADFQTLGDNLREMLRTEAQSVMTSGSGITMVTLLKEELESNRKLAQEQMEQSRKQTEQQMTLMQNQFQLFQTMMSALIPAQTNTNTNTQSTDNNTATQHQETQNNEASSVDSVDSTTPSDDTVQTQTTHDDKRITRSQQKKIVASNTDRKDRLSQESQPLTQPSENLSSLRQKEPSDDESMNQYTKHDKPASTPGASPPPKKPKGRDNATTLQSRYLNDEFNDVKDFNKTTGSEGAAGGKS
jgi:hypothetical protein